MLVFVTKEETFIDSLCDYSGQGRLMGYTTTEDRGRGAKGVSYKYKLERLLLVSKFKWKDVILMVYITAVEMNH